MNSFSFTSVRTAIQYAQNNQDKWCIYFSRYQTINAMARQISDNAVLCSTAGEYTQTGFSENAITGFSVSKDIAEIIEILPQMTKSYSTFKHAYKRIKDNPNAVLLLLCDGLSGKEEKILDNMLCIDESFKLIGGSAGDSLAFKETFIYIGQKRVFSVALFLNIQERTALIKENIYVPTGIQMMITDADRENRIVKTIEDEPASTAYAKFLNVPEIDLPQYFINHPLGKKIDNDIFIASPCKINEDKSISFYCQINPYSMMELLQPLDPLDTINATIAKFPFRPSFIFSINCILRSLKFKDENIWSAFDESLLAVTPNQCGFVSYGEQLYKRHMNQTMTALLIE